MFDFSVVLDKLNEMEVYNNNFNGNFGFWNLKMK